MELPLTLNKNLYLYIYIYKYSIPITHSLSIVENRVVCANCSSSVSIHAPHIYDFIKARCAPVDKYISIAIGYQHTHPSHCPVKYGGVIICTKCGSTALNKIVNLSETCPGVDSNKYSYGNVNIRRYNRGLSPLGYPDWPYGKLLPSHVQIIKSIQSQMKGVPIPTFARPALEPSDSEGEDIENASDVSLHGDTTDGSSSSL